jgi:hypothetical protein
MREWECVCVCENVRVWECVFWWQFEYFDVINWSSKFISTIQIQNLHFQSVLNSFDFDFLISFSLSLLHFHILLTICLFVCLFIYLFVYLFVCLFVCLWNTFPNSSIPCWTTSAFHAKFRSADKCGYFSLSKFRTYKIHW